MRWMVVAALGFGLCGSGRVRAQVRPEEIRVGYRAGATEQETAARQMLVEESGRRGRVTWTAVAGGFGGEACGGKSVVMGRREDVEGLLPKGVRAGWRARLAGVGATGAAEGFVVVQMACGGGSVVVIAGNDVRGELFGVGWVLRHMSFEGGLVRLPEGVRVFSAPDKAVRGHQIGYRMKNNPYDAWTLGQFEQQIRDLAIFGTNTIQVIAPVSDDAGVSPLMPAPPLETVVGISRLAAKYGLDCALYYPEMRKDYADAGEFRAEVRDFEALVKAMPRVDAVYVPGGDPGHTEPGVLFRLVKAEAEVARRWHPGASVWVSAQGFDARWYEEFYGLMGERPEWLTGVFFGPQSRDAMEVQRRRIPARYPVIFYPDIGHTMHAQFPVPKWDPVFALTEGREPICPRAEGFAGIYRHFAGMHAGFVTYSEGVNDDVNKIVWTRLGWDSGETVEEMLREYARWFLHLEGRWETVGVDAMLGLEKDWVGPVGGNREIGRTFGLIRELEGEGAGEGNWRWESLVYRGYYDSYVQRKFVREQGVEAEALRRLMGVGDSRARVEGALGVLRGSRASVEETREHDRLFELAGRLFRDGGLQLSVTLYGASNWERGANLDRVDTPLNERVWLEGAIASAMKEPDEEGRVQGLEGIARWERPVEGAVYDDLGDAGKEPHLVRGAGWKEDPEMYGAAIDGIADRTLADGWRLSWLSYAEALYEQPLEMRYVGLSAGKSYRVRITYAGEDYSVPLTLTAGDGVVIHEARMRRSNPETVELDVPARAIVGGELRLRWMRGAGGGGSGRGRQVAEVWILPGVG